MMRNAARLGVIGLVTSCMTLPPVSAPDVPAFMLGHVAITPLGGGVYAATRVDEPLGFAQNANSLFIVNDSDVIVVDAQFTREATLENLAALRRITHKPVGYVVTTHWHDDHFAGNQVYQDSFPRARFLAHANTRTDLVARGRPNREQQVKFAPQAMARFERLISLGLGVDSTSISPLERTTLLSNIRIGRQYLAEAPGFREVLPDSIPGSRFAFADGRRRVELRWFGRAATRGDLVVYLPDDGIVATGDVLDAPVPFAYGSYPTEWAAVLDSIHALHPRALVPGHGAVMHDERRLLTLRDLLRAAHDQVAAAVAANRAKDSVLNLVRLDDFRPRYADHDKWLESMFDNFLRRPVLARLYDEAAGRPLE
jgi:glyoxylase-like metal-dependent hydrolase (beta-lactamase superfamily II)